MDDMIVYRVEQIDWVIMNTPVSHISGTSAMDFNERYVTGLRDWYTLSGGAELLTQTPTVTSASYVASTVYDESMNLPELIDFDYPEGV